MRDERFEATVTFDARHDYIASAPELRSPVVRSLTNGLPSGTNVCTRRKRTCGPQGGSPGTQLRHGWLKIFAAQKHCSFLR